MVKEGTRNHNTCESARWLNMGPRNSAQVEGLKRHWFKWQIVQFQYRYHFPSFPLPMLSVAVRQPSVIIAGLSERLISVRTDQPRIHSYVHVGDIVPLNLNIFFTLWKLNYMLYFHASQILLHIFCRPRPARAPGSSSRTTSRWRTARTTTAATPSTTTTTSNRPRVLRPPTGEIKC